MRTHMLKIRGLAWKLAIPAVCLAAAGQLAFTGTASATHAAVPAQSATSSKFNLLDCNATLLMRECTDPHGKAYGGHLSRFRDPITGAYVGHDEPSVKFISSQPGSGNTFTYGMRLSRDPARAPTASASVTKYAELSIAPWFGDPICDPNSYPQNPCTPLSDSNTGLGAATDAGSAFMELQFYPPGFTPFVQLGQLQPDSVVRRSHHRQPRVQLQLRHLQQQLHRAGQLRVPADQRRAGRPARAAEHHPGDLVRQWPHAEDESRGQPEGVGQRCAGFGVA